MPKRTVKPDSERTSLQKGASEASREADFVEKKILPFPTLDRIPKPSLPLNSIGKKKYDELAQALYQAGRLTTFTQTQIEHIALQHQAAAIDIEKKGATSASRLTQIRHAMQEIGVDRINRPIAAPDEPEENRFARNGFAARRQPPARRRRG